MNLPTRIERPCRDERYDVDMDLRLFPLNTVLFPRMRMGYPHHGVSEDSSFLTRAKAS